MMTRSASERGGGDGGDADGTPGHRQLSENCKKRIFAVLLVYLSVITERTKTTKAGECSNARRLKIVTPVPVIIFSNDVKIIMSNYSAENPSKEAKKK